MEAVEGGLADTSESHRFSVRPVAAFASPRTVSIPALIALTWPHTWRSTPARAPTPWCSRGELTPKDARRQRHGCPRPPPSRPLHTGNTLAACTGASLANLMAWTATTTNGPHCPTSTSPQTLTAPSPIALTPSFRPTSPGEDEDGAAGKLVPVAWWHANCAPP